MASSSVQTQIAIMLDQPARVIETVCTPCFAGPEVLRWAVRLARHLQLEKPGCIRAIASP